MYVVRQHCTWLLVECALQACHLVKFLQKRKDASEDAALLAAIDWYCQISIIHADMLQCRCIDRFHYKNHIDPWCPYLSGDSCSCALMFGW